MVRGGHKFDEFKKHNGALIRQLIITYSNDASSFEATMNQHTNYKCEKQIGKYVEDLVEKEVLAYKPMSDAERKRLNSSYNDFNVGAFGTNRNFQRNTGRLGH